MRSGEAKQKQVSEWERYFKFEKIDGKNSILITKTYKKPLESKRKKCGHGLSNHRLYGIWIGMKERCNNKKSPAYVHYGGRGIKICDEWVNRENGFITFYNWSISNGYDDTLSIDRINNDGIYEPSNCRWTTMLVQARNRRVPINWRLKNKNYKSKLQLIKYIEYLEIQLKSNDLEFVINSYIETSKEEETI